jgi:predicted transcriptional regulator
MALLYLFKTLRNSQEFLSGFRGIVVDHFLFAYQYPVLYTIYTDNIITRQNMQTATIRISEASRRILREISRRDKKSMQAVLEQAIEAYRRQSFLVGLSADFAALRENEPEWQAEKAERTAWDITLTDGEEP